MCTMKIKKHFLFDNQNNQIRYAPSPNCAGKIVIPEYLVIHFTAGRSMQSSEKWLTDPTAKASAHLIIGRDGSIVQLVSFNKKAWHAGLSQWNGGAGLNSYSLGIELDNAGKLKRQGNKWVTWFGEEIPDEDVIVAQHKHEISESGWHAYTKEQLETALMVSATLVQKYNLLDIVGHDDIAPKRKTDPGPAFPMENFRAHILGRSENEDDMSFITTETLNIRSGPSARYEKLIPNGLPKGTKVVILEAQESWRFVDVFDSVGEEMDLQGWVHMRYLKRA